MGRNSFQCPLGKMHSRSEFVTFTEQLRKNGHGDPQFYSTHREKMPSSMIYPTLKIFSFVDVQIFFSNNCCDVMLGVLSERGSTDRRAYYSPLWCFWKRLNGLPQHCCGIIRAKHSFRIHWLLSGNSGYFNSRIGFSILVSQANRVVFITALRLENEEGDPNFLFYILD